MAWNNVLRSYDAIAASNLNQYVVVTGDTTTNNQVLVASSSGLEPVGVVFQATVASFGLAVNIARLGEVKVFFAASTGPWADVAVASTNGAVGPVIPTGAAASGASARTWVIGQSPEAHAAGDLGVVILNIRELI